MADNTAEEQSERIRAHRENRKKNLGRPVETNQAQAVAKYIRVPPRKARLVIDEIRGRYAEDALTFLRFIPNRAAVYISKVLASAVANAVNNHDLTADNLKLVEARVDEGPRLKRIQPRAQGRVYRILKRTSHITIILQEVEPKPRKPRKPTTGRRAQAARAAREGAAAPAAAPVAAPSPAPMPHAQAPEEPAIAPAAETPERSMAAWETQPEQVAPDIARAAADGEGSHEANTADKADEIGAPTEG